MLLALSGTFAKGILKNVIILNSQRSCEKYVKLDVYSDGKPTLTFLSMLKCDRMWVSNDVYAYTHRYLHIVYRQNVYASVWVHIYISALSQMQQSGD